jgi:two-component system nitrate/nitrite response regulator NarL
MKRPIRIFIADDHRLILDGLATLIGSIDGFELAGKFPTGKDMIEALQKIVRLPDICIVDIEMPGMDGVETVKNIRKHFPDQKIMVLTMHDEWHFVSKMIAAGADGYLLKNVERDVFIETINKVLSGDSFITEGLSQKKSENTGDLTDREKDILKRIVAGKSNKEIGDELFISARTADTHRTNIKKKLKLTTLSQLMQYAKEHDIR